MIICSIDKSEHVSLSLHLYRFFFSSKFSFSCRMIWWLIFLLNQIDDHTITKFVSIIKINFIETRDERKSLESHRNFFSLLHHCHRLGRQCKKKKMSVGKEKLPWGRSIQLRNDWWSNKIFIFWVFIWLFYIWEEKKKELKKTKEEKKWINRINGEKSTTRWF